MTVGVDGNQEDHKPLTLEAAGEGRVGALDGTDVADHSPVA
jgi:hypothetical protein